MVKNSRLRKCENYDLDCRGAISDSSIIISDIRVSRKRSEGARQNADVYCKLVPYYPNLGFFVAGSVRLWQRINAEVIRISQSVTFDNLLDHEGPLWTTLDSQAIKDNSDKSSGAIGILLDAKNNQHQLFKVTLDPGNGCIIELIEPGCGQIIGTGKNRKTEACIRQFARRSMVREPDGLRKMAHAMRERIRHLLRTEGIGVFTQTGVSPFMMIAYAHKGGFKLSGEESSGVYVDYITGEATFF